MALRAGYVGIKKTMIGMIEKLSSAKIIKTIGNGLKLTSAGTLSCDIDSNTMEFKSGKLAAKGGGVVYAETEYSTGDKWIDGSVIYGIVKTDLSIPLNAYSLNVTIPGAAKVLSIRSAVSAVTDTGINTLYFTQEVSGDDIIIHPTDSFAAHSADLIIEYLKTES